MSKAYEEALKAVNASFGELQTKIDEIMKPVSVEDLLLQVPPKSDEEIEDEIRETLRECIGWLRHQHALELQRRPNQQRSRMKKFAEALERLLWEAEHASPVHDPR